MKWLKIASEIATFVCYVLGAGYGIYGLATSDDHLMIQGIVLMIVGIAGRRKW